MTTAQLIKKATEIATKRNELSGAREKTFWKAIKDAGLDDVGCVNGPRDENGHVTPHHRWSERHALIDDRYTKLEADYKAAGVEVKYAIHDEVICEVTLCTKWNGRGHHQHRFYVLKGYKRNGEIKRGRFTAEKAVEKLG